MIQPPRVDDSSHVSPRRPDGSRGRRGTFVGPVRVTPIRAVLAIALVGSLGFIAFAILKVRDSSQIPMVTSGLAVLAIVFAALSVGGAIRMWRSWQEGLQGQTVLFAFLGGVAGAIALGCISGVLVLALLWGSSGG
jgi:hypothetical protein